MTTSPILQPVITLVLWTFVMWAWLYATRIPAINRLKVPLDPTRPHEEFNANIPPQVRWKADNYNHLHEQPTLFYAVALVLAFTGAEGLGVWLAWAYVAIRVVHSLVQATTNTIIVRFSLFMLGSLVLLAMTVLAAMAVF
ncbi:MAPEG family protein [soil metagenome]